MQLTFMSQRLMHVLSVLIETEFVELQNAWFLKCRLFVQANVPWLPVCNFINCLNPIKLTPWNLGTGHSIRLWRKPRNNSTTHNLIYVY
jgi:hypothetical protein